MLRGSTGEGGGALTENYESRWNGKDQYRTEEVFSRFGR